MTPTIYHGDGSELVSENFDPVSTLELGGLLCQLDEALDSLLTEPHSAAVQARALATLSYVRGRVAGVLA